MCKIINYLDIQEIYSRRKKLNALEKLREWAYNELRINRG
jgi:hypothetical protein